VVGVITVFVLAYLMVLEGSVFIDSLLNLFEPRSADRISTVGSGCAKTITGYLSGNLLISIICGLLTYAVLRIVGAPFAGLVALFVAIVDLIPLVGATLGALVAGAAGFVHSVPVGITVVVFFVIYQQVENHFLQPVIYARTVKLSPRRSDRSHSCPHLSAVGQRALVSQRWQTRQDHSGSVGAHASAVVHLPDTRSVRLCRYPTPRPEAVGGITAAYSVNSAPKVSGRGEKPRTLALGGRFRAVAQRQVMAWAEQTARSSTAPARRDSSCGFR
jgi:hypothetical protein